MPYKNGHLTPKERKFAKHYANTGDQVYAATKAGYHSPTVRGSELAKKPAVEVETLKLFGRKMVGLLPLVADGAEKMLTSKLTKDGARLGVFKFVAGEAKEVAKEIAEQVYEEPTLQKITSNIQRLEQERKELLRLTIDVAPSHGVFG